VALMVVGRVVDFVCEGGRRTARGGKIRHKKYRPAGALNLHSAFNVREKKNGDSTRMW